MNGRLRRAMGAGFIGKLFDRHREQLAAQLRKEMADIAKAEADRIIAAIHMSDWNRVRNIMGAAHEQSVIDSATFANQHMPKAQTFWHQRETLRHALSLAPRGGMALEFGVATGGTLSVIAEVRRGQGGVYGFDSFEGLPETWRTGVPKGAFATSALPQVDGAELVKGWFDQTLPAFLATHPGPVDFLHVDCDIYSSTKTIFDLVGSRLRPGSIVLFDEFFNYPSWQEHEYKAWLEFVDRTGIKFVYECYTANDEQVAVRIVA
nr:class I SAM-dependent methyltransferase [Panacagrimonas sp.]